MQSSEPAKRDEKPDGSSQGKGTCAICGSIQNDNFIKQDLGRGMAESGGFEPPVQVSPYNGLANRRLQPLGQLSSDYADWNSVIITEPLDHFIRERHPPGSLGKRMEPMSGVEPLTY